MEFDLPATQSVDVTQNVSLIHTLSNPPDSEFMNLIKTLPNTATNPWCLTIFSFLDFDTVVKLRFVCKSWNHVMQFQIWDQFLCESFSTQFGVYIPSKPSVGSSYKSLLREAMLVRDLWKPVEDIEEVGQGRGGASQDMQRARDSMEHPSTSALAQPTQRFKISVFAKFRPFDAATAAAIRSKESSAVDSTKKLSVRERLEASAGMSNPATDSPITSTDHSESPETEEESMQKAGKAVTLPLHQRLQMIRLSKKKKIGVRQALQILAEEGGWFNDAWNALADQADAVESVNTEKVENTSCEDRMDISDTEKPEEDEPINNFDVSFRGIKNLKAFREARELRRQREAKAKANGIRLQDAGKVVSRVQNIDPLQGSVVMVTPDVGLRQFNYDGVLPVNASQNYSYESVARPLIVDLINGFNATSLVYGQTGSGKTFTMFGGPQESRGIIPRACEEIFQAIEKRRKNSGIESVIRVSYVEIYGEEVTDLLNFGSRVGHAKIASQRFVLNGHAEHPVSSLNELNELLVKGDAQKRRAATMMNERSSRAHSLFILSLEQRRPHVSDVTIKSKLFLADLGGSEQLKKSLLGQSKQVVPENPQENTDNTNLISRMTGEELNTRMKEAIYINLGLFAIKKCVEALNQHAHYIPFQESKLTKLLSEGLGGNCKTSIIICSSLDPMHSSETVATLRFGERCATVQTNAQANASLLAGILDDLDNRIADLEKQIQLKERWEQREMVVEDRVAGEEEVLASNLERRNVTVVVGAEAERKQLLELIAERSKYTGEPLEDEDTVVVGFGRQYAEMYGLGAGYDESAEQTAQNARFNAAVEKSKLPSVFAKKTAKSAWAEGEITEEDPAVLARRAEKIKRTRLAYAGFSL